jgi:peptide/nickel transport system ATP-binding protein
MKLEAVGLSFRYNPKSAWVYQDFSLSIASGERVGLVARSGFGKSTLAKLLSGYEKPSAGQILLDGLPIPKKGFSPVQLISQHPEEAINPRLRLLQALQEADCLNYADMDRLGIEDAWLDRFPRELSGGELQRFCIMRAFGGRAKIDNSKKPPQAETGCHNASEDWLRFVIADEISTMLDVVTQAQVFRYLLEQTDARGLGLVLITHNLALAKRVCTRIIHLDKQ